MALDGPYFHTKKGGPTSAALRQPLHDAGPESPLRGVETIRQQLPALGVTPTRRTPLVLDPAGEEVLLALVVGVPRPDVQHRRSHLINTRAGTRRCAEDRRELLIEGPRERQR